MFSVTITSNSQGARTNRSAVASTYMQSAAMSGWRAARSRKMLRKNAIDGSTLALSTHVTRPALPLRPALPGQPEREVTQPLGDAAADAERVEDDVRTVAAAHLAGREEAFGRLADQDAVDARGPGVGERRRRAGEHPDWPDPGIQPEPIAKIEVRGHLGAVGIADVGQSHGPEQDGVRRFGALQRGGRKGLAGAPVQLGPGFEEGEAEREAPDAFGDGLEQRDTRLHDLAADPVAGKDGYLKLAHTHPSCHPGSRPRLIQRT